MDLIRDLVTGKKVIATAMKKEVDRVRAALDAALAGDSCALVCSGDPGVYALAGLVLEICRQNRIALVKPGAAISEADGSGSGFLALEVVPGVPALASGAALLGAPLVHDFACVSLSDLLTPWETIEKRIEHAAAADFVIVLFNPKSKKRTWQLARAVELVLQHRDPDTPVGLVRNAMRSDQQVSIVTLGRLPRAEVDMRTTVFVGNSASTGYLGFMFTPRGYAEKYDLSES